MLARCIIFVFQLSYGLWDRSGLWAPISWDMWSVFRKDIEDLLFVKHISCTKVCGRRLGTCNHICRRPCYNGTNCGPCFSACEVRRRYLALELWVLCILSASSHLCGTQKHADGCRFVVPTLNVHCNATNLVHYVSKVVLGCASTGGVAACRVLLLVAAFHAINTAPERFLADISARGSVARCAVKSIAICAPINKMLE